jgi:hypothetical protein
MATPEVKARMEEQAAKIGITPEKLWTMSIFEYALAKLEAEEAEAAKKLAQNSDMLVEWYRRG